MSKIIWIRLLGVSIFLVGILSGVFLPVQGFYGGLIRGGVLVFCLMLGLKLINSTKESKQVHS